MLHAEESSADTAAAVLNQPAPETFAMIPVLLAWTASLVVVAQFVLANDANRPILRIDLSCVHHHVERKDPVNVCNDPICRLTNDSSSFNDSLNCLEHWINDWSNWSEDWVWLHRLLDLGSLLSCNPRSFSPNSSGYSLFDKKYFIWRKSLDVCMTED